MSKLLIILAVPLFLVGCQSSPSQSESSTGRKIESPGESGLFSSIFKGSSPKTIALPPDLVSTANSKVQENHKKAEREASQKVLPDVIGAEVVNQNGQRWLRVESDAQEVWDTLANFWAAEQIDLVEFKPAAGLMETDWIAANADANEKKSIVARLFNRVVGNDTSFDKYKIRLEKDEDAITNIFVTHRFTEKKESKFNSPAKVTEWEWVEGEGDQEKVAQLLQVMVLLFETPEVRLNTSA
ncbi:MAG: outer membrane protein assembly factor BamC [Acidiferrobacterales bacterium]|nr:outer membrane protein assembly factor BamC [Acidiferrobacterales bacterium]